ncbi:hypothetical protein H5410_028101 [Solanum commersonii]|uniref:Uncharacterized protein n=1 Tax=Solanum commersonii TaxID=4109 RepID=A0A9J5Z143_SOLCO|nr:hypothetical protein H5410_028101 [Solanum commersonii]
MAVEICITRTCGKDTIKARYGMETRYLNDTRNSRMRRQTVMGSGYTREILGWSDLRNSREDTHSIKLLAMENDRKVKVPFKVACFTWLLAKQVVLTPDNRMKKGPQFVLRMFFVNVKRDNKSSLLHQETVKLWQIFISKGASGLCRKHKGSFGMLESGWKSGHRERWKIVPPHLVDYLAGKESKMF